LKFYISLPDPELAQGQIAAFSFNAHGVDEFAAQLQRALRDSRYIQSWLNSLDEDDAGTVDPELLVIDANAKVSGLQHDLSFALVADTSINGAAFKHRMRLLAGNHWQLTDVK
jgi:hypothetical protein